MAKNVALTVTVTDTQFNDFVKKFNDLVKQMESLNQNWQKISNTITNATNSSQKFATTINILAVHSRGIHSNVQNITKHFYKWGALVAGIGMLLGGGGLFGLNRLSQTIMARQRFMLGTGTATYGSAVAAQTFGKSLFDDPAALSQRLAAARTTQGAPGFQALQAMGLSPTSARVRAMDDAQLREAFLRRLPDFLKEHGLTDRSPNLGLITGPKGFKITDILSPEDIRKAASPQGARLFREEADREAAYRAQGPTPEQLETWRKFWLSITDFTNKVETEWTKHLTPIAGALTDVSKSMTDLVTALLDMPAVQSAVAKLASWMETFATFLEKDETKKNLEDFINEVGKIVRLLFMTPTEILDEAERRVKEGGTGPKTPSGVTVPPGWIVPPGSPLNTPPGTSPGTPPAEPPAAPPPPATPVAPPGLPSVTTPSFQVTPPGMPSAPTPGYVPGATPGGVSDPLFQQWQNIQNMKTQAGGGDTPMNVWGRHNLSPTLGSRLGSFRGASGRGLPTPTDQPQQEQKQGALDIDNWQSTRTASLVVRGVPSSNLFLQANGMG